MLASEPDLLLPEKEKWFEKRKRIAEEKSLLSQLRRELSFCHEKCSWWEATP